MHKYVLFLLVLILMLGILAGCGQTDVPITEAVEPTLEDTLLSTTQTVTETEPTTLPTTTVPPTTEPTTQAVTESTSCAHNYIISQDVQASCMTPGYTEYYCTNCYESYVEQTAYATGHSYTSYLIEPTMDSEGYTIYTCIFCGNSYSADFVPKLERMNWTEEMVIQLCNEVEIYAEYNGCVIYDNCGSWDGYLNLTEDWDYASAYAYLVNSVDQIQQKGYCAVNAIYKDANACWRVYVRYNRNYQPEG